MNPKVSVIIPVYKVEDYLDECLESVVKQTYKNIEVILIDDGSPDNCSHMCDDWAIKDERIKVVHQQNSGLSAARNKGIEISGGEYILFVDSDDYIDESTIEKTVAVALENEADIVCFGVFKVNQNGEIIESTENFEKKTICARDAIRDLAAGTVHDYTWNKLLHKSVFSNVRFPVGKAFEDIATMYKLFSNAKKISYLPDELYFYRKRQGSIISQMKTSSLQDLFTVRKERYDYLKTNYPEAAEDAFELTAISALNFYDVSLWERVDQKILNDAVNFLANNCEEGSEINNKMKLYLCCPPLYKNYRKIKHFIGNIIKSVHNKYRV